ncbi:MAG: hypothetical protein AAGU15_09070 [Anaerolineaceae bacterium]
MNILKQSTAATIKLGPFVDDTDGKTAETALTIGQADIRLSKNGGDIAQTNNATGATHDELGYYNIPLDTTDTGTLGRLRVLVSKAGALPVWQDFVVVTANVYDSMFSTDKLDVAVVEMATDVLTAASVKADAVTKIQSGLATPTNITAGTITTVTNLTNLPNGTGTNQISLSGGKVLLQATQTGVTIPTVTAVGTTTNLTNLPTMPTDWVTAAGLKADAVTEIQSGLATAAALDAVDNFIDTEVAAILAAVDTEVAAIKAKTDNLPATPASAGEYTAAIAAIPTAPLLAANYTAPDNAGIAAIQEKTEQLTFTAPNKVDASATVDPTGIATSAELEIVGGKVDGVLNKLNVSSVEFVTAVVGSTITILRGDTLSARLLDLGDITQYVSLDFTVKLVSGELDDAARIRLRKNASGTGDGLLRLNGAEYATATDGSIVIDDLTTGDIEIKLMAAATQDLVPGNYVYDIQLITANEVKTLTSGTCKVTADVTRATA